MCQQPSKLINYIGVGRTGPAEPVCSCLVTAPVLTSDGRKEEKNTSSPKRQMFAVRGGKLGIYTLHNPPDILRKLALCGG